MVKTQPVTASNLTMKQTPRAISKPTICINLSDFVFFLLQTEHSQNCTCQLTWTKASQTTVMPWDFRLRTSGRNDNNRSAQLDQFDDSIEAYPAYLSWNFVLSAHVSQFKLSVTVTFCNTVSGTCLSESFLLEFKLHDGNACKFEKRLMHVDATGRKESQTFLVHWGRCWFIHERSPLA